MTNHELKIWPEPFIALISGIKTYEVRKSDRPFAVGDKVLFREWDPERNEYTGEECEAKIIHLTPSGMWGLPHNICVFGLELVP